MTPAQRGLFHFPYSKSRPARPIAKGAASRPFEGAAIGCAALSKFDFSLKKSYDYFELKFDLIKNLTL